MRSKAAALFKMLPVSDITTNGVPGMQASRASCTWRKLRRSVAP